MGDVLSKIKLALAKQGLEASIDSSRVVISTQYDLDYQITTLGLVFHFFKSGRTRSGADFIKINRMMLRLVHFLVLRPAMIPEFKYWYSTNISQKMPTLDDWTTFPRGFLSDSAQADTISLLIIRHELIESGKDIILDIKAMSRINKLTRAVTEMNLFVGEIKAIRELSALKMQLNVLGF